MAVRLNEGLGVGSGGIARAFEPEPEAEDSELWKCTFMTLSLCTTPQMCDSGGRARRERLRARYDVAPTASEAGRAARSKHPRSARDDQRLHTHAASGRPIWHGDLASASVETERSLYSCATIGPRSEPDQSSECERLRISYFVFRLWPSLGVDRRLTFDLSGVP